MTSNDPARRSPAKTKTVSTTNPRDGLISIRHGDVRFHQVVLVLQWIVRRDKTFKRITAFQRDPVGERNAGLKIKHIVITTLCSVVEPIIAKPVLQQNPGRLAAQTEAIA